MLLHKFTNKKVIKATVKKLNDNITEASNPNKFFETPTELIRVLARGGSHALLLEGKGGLGKTRLVLEVLKNEGFTLGGNAELIKAYTTPLALYKLLYEYKDKSILIFDDCENLFNNKICVSLLKGCLDNGTGVRTVQYHTTSKAGDDAPNTFEITCRVIVIANTLPYGLDFEAVRDRCAYYCFHASNEEVLGLMSDVYKHENALLELAGREEVFLFLKENVKPYHEFFSMRTLIKGYGFRKHSLIWKDLILGTLPVNEEHKLVYDLNTMFENVKDQFIKFHELTGLSERSFRRLRNKLGYSRKYDVLKK